MWGAADMADLQQTWAEGLWDFEASDLREALSVVGSIHHDYPPTLPQFAGLCRDAKRKRAQTTARLDSPRAHVDHEFIARIAAGIGRPKDGKAWARRILERVEQGEIMPAYAVQCAREVVGQRAAPTIRAEDVIERAAIQCE